MKGSDGLVTSTSVVVTVDSTFPTLSVSVSTQSGVTVNAGASEPVKWILNYTLKEHHDWQQTIFGQTFSTSVSQHLPTLVEGSTYLVQLVAEDLSGNVFVVAEPYYSFVAPVSAPQIVISSPADNAVIT